MKLLRSLACAFNGLKWVVAAERNMKIHLAATVVVVAAAAACGISRLEWALVVLSIAMVLVAEQVNSAVEKVVDTAAPEFNSLAGKAKDASAGAVLLAAFFSVVIGLIIFFPYIKEILQK